MGRRYHLHSDSRRLAVPGHRARSVQPRSRRLVAEATHELAVAIVQIQAIGGLGQARPFDMGHLEPADAQAPNSQRVPTAQIQQGGGAVGEDPADRLVQVPRVPADEDGAVFYDANKAPRRECGYCGQREERATTAAWPPARAAASRTTATGSASARTGRTS